VPRHVLFVHAHPDDESISTGGAIATLIDAGTPVTVLTLTRGELGEVIPVELRHLEGTDALAGVRELELANALTALGVTDHRFLGEPDARWPGREPRRYLDSGMQWGENGAEALPNSAAESLSTAPLGEVAADIAAVINDTSAELVVSYDQDGGYGHPDHVRAHVAAKLAADVAGAQFWAITPEHTDGAIPVDVSAVIDRKRAALAAHSTQLRVTANSYELSNGNVAPIADTEYFLALPSEQPAAARGSAKPPGVWPKLAASVLALVTGALAGAIGTATHQSIPPFGVALALVMVVCLLGGFRILFDSRLAAAAAAVGVLGAVAMFSGSGPGGSVLVPATGLGYWWTFGPAVTAFIVLAWPRLPARRMDNVPEVKERVQP
jgi:N-acetyl-1-D-myo-inositol-2-amino-2-deoxy-alpha-D-glucopyranoside deacetylase